MWIYLVKRILYAIPIALGVSLVCFCLIYLAPGDPSSSLIPPDATAADIAIIKQSYGFDQPLPVQFARWLWRAMHGDLGISLQTNRPVSDEVLHALSNTIEIVSAAAILAFTLATCMGVAAAYYRGRAIDRIFTSVSAIGISIPAYWLGIVLVILFAVKLRWLPATGMGSHDSAGWLDWQQLKFAILPAVTMTFLPLGVVMRSTRAAVADALGHEYVHMLRAKGLSPRAIIYHGLRNALPQIVAIMGLQLGYLIGGSILVETVFTWPGTGFLLSKAILTRDIPLLQGAILVLALCFVLINLAVDLLQAMIDPRMKRI